MEGKRMAKSLGNFYTLRDLVAKDYDPKAIRYLLLSTHYRQQLNFTFEGLDASKAAIERLTNLMRRLSDANGQTTQKTTQLIETVTAAFNQALDDDLNTSNALAALFEFAREINSQIDQNQISQTQAKQIADMLAGYDKVLGVLTTQAAKQELSAEAQELIKKREEARKAKDWKTADTIRQQLKTMGIIIEDTAQGMRWRIEKT